MPPHTPQDANGNRATLEFRTTVLVILVALVVWLMPSTFQASVAASLRGTVLRPFLGLQQALASAQIRAENTAALQARIDSLMARAMSRTTLEEENRRLRGLLQLGERLGPRWRAVQIARGGTSPNAGSLHVYAGRAHGVEPGAALLTREGLAGVVVEVATNRSVGYDWTHPDFRASAMTLDGLHFGIVRPYEERDAGGGLRRPRLKLEGLRYSAEVEPGTVVVTSGYGDLPRGLPIGRVSALADSLEDSREEWRKSFWLEPLVEAASVTLGLVELEDAAPQEDLSGAWAGAGFLRAEERTDREEALEDTVRILRDSLERLRRDRAVRSPPGAP